MYDDDFGRGGGAHLVMLSLNHIEASLLEAFESFSILETKRYH